MNQFVDTQAVSSEATALQEERPAPAELSESVARARACIEQGDLEEGLEAFRAIANANPEIPEVFNNLGAICAAMGRHDEAETAFGRAVELTPDAANPWYNRGLMRFETGNNLGALEDFRQAHTLDPTDPEFLNNLGVVHFQLREWDDARECFAKAVELRPDYVAALLNEIDVDLAEGHDTVAYEAARRLATEVESPAVHAKLLQCSEQLALAAIENAEEDCRDVEAHAGVNPALTDRRARLQRARTLLLQGSLTD